MLHEGESADFAWPPVAWLLLCEHQVIAGATKRVRPCTLPLKPPKSIPRLRLQSQFGPKLWRDTRIYDYGIKGLSVLALIGFWYLATWRLPSTIMPPPHTVVRVLWEDMREGGI